jgi:ABC-2 type transport system ATP-binding protein
VRRRIGFLPDVPGFYDWMTGDEFLRFAGGLFGLRGPRFDERVAVLLDLAGLTDVSTRIGGFSRGMKQRLGVAQALVNAPTLLMLDEPTSALDPIGRKDVLDMLASLRGRTTVFFSTHILSDVERICDTVAILDAGKVVAHGAIDDLKARYGAQKVVIEVDEGTEWLAGEVGRAPWASAVTVTDDGAIEIAVSDARAARCELPAIVASRGLALRRMEAGEVDLEDVFVELVGGGRS